MTDSTQTKRKKHKQPLVLIVEDSLTQAQQLRFILEENGFDVRQATDGEEGLQMAREHHPQIVISDIMMPLMNGYEMCRAMKDDDTLQNVPVILLTVLSDHRDIINGLMAGADNFIIKPYNEDYLVSRVQYMLANSRIASTEKSQMAVQIQFDGQQHSITADRLQILNLLLSTYDMAVQKNTELSEAQAQLQALNEDLERRVEERTESLKKEISERKKAEVLLESNYKKMSDLFDAVVHALGHVVEMKDRYTAGHQRRVSWLSVAIAEQMGFSRDQIETIRIAALLHDIGKISVPSEILNKPGVLSDCDIGIVRIHPEAGYRLLREIDFGLPVAEVVAQHHERMDGSGYPDGISDDILPEARVLAVADVVEAISSDRPYRPKKGLSEAVSFISEKKGTLFDEQVVDACLDLVSGYDSFTELIEELMEEMGETETSADFFF